MTDGTFDDISLAAAARTYVLETGPVLVLRLDADNRVVEANAQARRLLGDDAVGRYFAEAIAHCAPFDLAALPECDGQVSRLTFNAVLGKPETLYFRFFPLPDGLLALGSLDLGEQRKLVDEMQTLNSELNCLARKLQQANAELREMNDFKTRHAREIQAHNDTLRQQTLASLNLMEDAVQAREQIELANKALREREAQFRDLVEGAPDAIFVQTERLFAYVNAAACRLFGADSPDRLLGTPVLDRIHPSSRRLVQARMRAVRDRICHPPADVEWLKLDGSTVSVGVSASPITYIGKEGALVFGRDITERLKSAEALRLSEQRYRSLIEAAPDAIAVANGAGKIVLINSRLEKMFGYSREELTRHNIRMLLPERFRRVRWWRRELSFGMHRGPADELFGLRSDGTEFPIEVTLSPVETEQGVLILGAIRDVTERKNAEQRNRRLEISAAEAEAANKAKSMFLSTMSHEIRTPMNAILGYSQLMLRDASLGPDARANLKIINRSGEHLLEMINDILDMAKIEAGRLQLTPATLDIRGLVRDLEAMFRLRFEAKALQFDVFVAGEPEQYIVADEGKMRQVLINLLGNAFKFTERGRVALDIDLRRGDGGQLRLSAEVADTGVGIPEEEQGKLFQTFVQGETGQRSLHGGTGLGLAISRGLARLMGGDLSLTSQPGVGSTFRFEVPVERGGDRRTRARSGRVIGIQAGEVSPRILIADDVPDNRDWLSRLLTAVGLCVRSVENGDAAVRAWDEWRPRLILMDVHMPVMDGLEATRRIRSLPGGETTAVIALTADVVGDHPRVVMESGVNDFISKPCREGELLEKIRRHLGLKYVYEADVVANHAQSAARLPYPEPSSEQLRKLPPDLIKEMHDAVLNGDTLLLGKLIRIVEATDVQAARGLQELAEVYQYAKLIELLGQSTPPTQQFPPRGAAT